MVERLPDDGGIVVVHCASLRDYVRRMIRDVRGAAVADRVDIRVLRSRSDISASLCGRSCTVEVDHAWWSNVHPGAAALMAAILPGIAVAFAARCAPPPPPATRGGGSDF
ncbi:MAG: hypothetical protein KF735_02320 [Chelatococcus sp.]|uniref:hypothetical protein n=1 Tax=Chelatococcus sp. TaxID=1953771 RepID=UPI0025BF07F0|nr:hypothetical protein [Chelatococcus sp.]MBX3536448.1 hypothetical protein [Chelatococcus sp.]